MPTYNYNCNDCLLPFEIFISYNLYGKKNVSCPICSSRNVSRIISPPVGISFNGSGFTLAKYVEKDLEASRRHNGGTKR
jgi:putative FmdB family regulatory protein